MQTARSLALAWGPAALVMSCGGSAATPPAPMRHSPFMDDAAVGLPELYLPMVPSTPPADAGASPIPIPFPTDGATPAIGADAAPLPSLDAGPEGACDHPPAPGDLAIDELMIESVAGAGDYGEWIEIASMADCALNLRGLHGECPRGATVATFDVATDLWISAQGSLVVADSTDPAINHYLPGLVVGWNGHPGDVLRNKGTTVTLTLSGTVLDSVTYPALPLVVGTSMSFPADCDPSLRADWTRWATSVSSWFPGFDGTPSAPNVDVSCGGP